MSASQIFIAQHSGRITNAGYPNSYCPYQSPVRMEHITLEPINNSSLNMVKALNFDVISKKLNADIR
jgi:hypothetical protein